MAQNSLKTLSFVLIFVLPILWTVITAFRVRDLPKDVRCANCNSDSVKFSDRSESLRAYEELKKAVREKLLGSEKKSYSPKSFGNDNDDDDDDDDDAKQVINRNDKKHDAEIKKVTKVNVPNNKNKFSFLDQNDNSDNDDGKNDHNEYKKDRKPVSKKVEVSHLKLEDSKKVKDSKINTEMNKGKLKTPMVIKKKSLNDDDDDEDDDDDDDEDELEFKVQLGKINRKDDTKKSDSNSKAQAKASTHVNDGYEDKKGYTGTDNKIFNVKSESNKGKVNKEVLKRKNNDDGDDDEDDDDDNDGDEDDDNDDDDDDDNDDGDRKDKTNLNAKQQKQSTMPVKSKKDEDSNTKIKPEQIKQDLKPKVQEFDKTKKTNLPDPKKNNDGKTSQINKGSQKENIQNATKDKSKAPKQEKPVTKSEPTKKTESSQQSDNKSSKKQKSVTDKTNKKTNEADSKPKTGSKNENVKKSTDNSINKEKRYDKKRSHKDEEPFETLHDVHEILARRDSYLKEVNEALQRRNLLKSEFEDFYAFLPTFAPNFSRIHNPECRRHGQILLRQLRGTKLWALSMLDATAKFPSGILQGNGIQLGDFDQCLESRARVQLDTKSVVKVQGKYCLALLDLKSEHPELDIPVHLAQAKGLINSKIDDPGHFIPRFSTLSWGICVPSTCEHDDVELIVRDAIKHYQHTSGVVIRVRVDPDDCHWDEGGEWWEDWMELPTLLTVLLYAVVVLLVLAGTLQDYLGRKSSSDAEETQEGADEKTNGDQPETKEDEEENEDGAKKKASDNIGVLQCFSLYHTTSKLFAPAADEEVSCIHGIRALATLALLVAHKFMAVAATPYTNRLRVTEEASAAWWSWSRAGWMYTDCFLLLSGTLAAYRASSGSDASAPRRLLSRYTRLTPALLAVVLFYAYIWDITGEGPMWGTLVTKNAEICQENWLWNVFYVQNYFGLEEMCAPQTHQLALDMQLTILGCLIIWIMQLKPRVSKIMLVLVQVGAAYSRYSVAYEHRLTMLAYHGASISQLYRTGRLSYTSVVHRSTPYLIGLSLGFLLQKGTKPHKLIMILGWLISLTLWGLVWYAGLDAGSLSYRYEVGFAAQYSSLAPLATALAIAWWIYAVHVGGDGFLQSVLSSQPLALISRLSYALYLCQFVVFFTKAAIIRTASEFTWISLIDVQEITALIVSSTVLTLTFIIPIQSLQKAITIFSKSASNDEQENTTNEEEGEKKEDDKEADGDVTKEENEDIQYEVEEEQEIEKVTSKTRFLAHREVLEEIPEVEIEYEIQRERNEILQEILEEDDEETVSEIDEDRDQYPSENELEVIEEEGGEDDFWADRETAYVPRRSFSADDDDSENYDWRNGRNSSGAQYHRYNR